MKINTIRTIISNITAMIFIAPLSMLWIGANILQEIVNLPQTMAICYQFKEEKKALPKIVDIEIFQKYYKKEWDSNQHYYQKYSSMKPIMYDENMNKLKLKIDISSKEFIYSL